MECVSFQSRALGLIRLNPEVHAITLPVAVDRILHCGTN